jgi:hypothetical protein
MADMLAASSNLNPTALKKLIKNLVRDTQLAVGIQSHCLHALALISTAQTQIPDKEIFQRAVSSQRTSSVYQLKQQRRRQGKQSTQPSRLVGRSEPSYVFSPKQSETPGVHFLW